MISGTRAAACQMPRGLRGPGIQWAGGQDGCDARGADLCAAQLVYQPNTAPLLRSPAFVLRTEINHSFPKGSNGLLRVKCSVFPLM